MDERYVHIYIVEFSTFLVDEFIQTPWLIGTSAITNTRMKIYLMHELDLASYIGNTYKIAQYDAFSFIYFSF